MTGLVAVVALDRAVGVTDEDLEPLLRAYESLRGPSARTTRLAGGTVVRAARLEGVAGCPQGAARRPPADRPRTGSAVAEECLFIGRPSTSDGTVPGLRNLADADGQFALIGYDRVAEDVVVATDPFGMVALYVTEHRGRAYVSTSSLALAVLVKAPAERLAVQSFLLSGYHFGTGNHWRGVERLQPSTAVRYTPDGRTSQRLWRPQPDDAVRRLRLPEAVDHCIEVAVADLERMRGRETWVDLTGGYDSRLLSLLLSRSGVLARANTRHTTDPREVEIAGRVAAVLGLEWVHPSLPSDWSTVLPAMLDYSLVWGDAQLEVLQLSRVLWPHGLLARRLPHLLSAGGGEHLQFAAWKSEFRAAGRSNRVNYDNWIDMRMLKPVRNAVLAGDPRPAVREDMRARLSSWVSPYADHANTTQLDLLYAYKSTGHFGAYRSADDGLLQAGLPFYFRRTFEAAFSTDFRHRNAHRLMRHMMHRLHPTAAALPTTRGGPAQPWRLSNTHRFAPYYGQLARKAVTKISDQVMGRPLLLERRGFPWAASAHAAVLEVLAPDGASRADHLLSAELYDPRAVEQLLRDAVVPGFEDSALLGRLVTVELALRKVGGGVSR